MIQALNVPYSSKRDEIMSRYRPIAPKPQLSSNNTTINGGGTNGPSSGVEGPLVPEKFRQSPYLRNIWSHLQARPTRTRKRGRTAGISPVSMLRKQQEYEHEQQQLLYQQKNIGGFMGLCSSNASNISFHAFGLYGSDQHASANNVNLNDNRGKNNTNDLVELPLLSCSLLTKSKSIDLNTISEGNSLEERDLLLQLQIPTNNNSNVISPRPVRPVGSTISIVGPIGEDPEAKPVEKVAEKVEEDVEVELLPAVISDRANKVRMVNSAYKELVGQPECPWLDSMMISRVGRRISGEVMFRVEGLGLPMTSNGFSCWVRIEWESEGKKKNVNAFCEVARLVCESKDYVYYWRFHTRQVSPSGSKV